MLRIAQSAIFGIFTLLILSSCEGQRLKNQIADINDELLPEYVYDGFSLYSISYGNGYNSDKCITFNISVDNSYTSNFLALRANFSDADIANERQQLIQTLNFEPAIRDLISLATNRGYSLIFRFHYSPVSNFDIGFWDM